MGMIRNLTLVAVILSAGLGSTGCGAYVEAESPEVVADGYEPQYYDGRVVYFDNGRPFYYDNGLVVWIPPSSPYYAGYVNHWAVYGPAYTRWYAGYGYRYRGWVGYRGYYGGHAGYRVYRPAYRGGYYRRR